VDTSAQLGRRQAKDSARSQLRTKRILGWSVLLNLVLPGLASLLLGRRWVGAKLIAALGITWSLGWFGLLGYLAWSGLNNHQLFFTLITSDSFLLSCQVALAGNLIFAIFAGAHGIYATGKSNFGKAGKGLLAAVLALVTAAQVATYATAVSYIQSQRDLIHQVFAIGGADTAYAATRTGSAAAGVAAATPRVNILLLGGDAGKDRWGLRPDSISILSVNAKTGKTVIFGIPRNMQKVPFAPYSPLWKAFPHGYNCGEKCLINALYTYANGHPKLYAGARYKGKVPGVEATREAAEGVLGMRIPFVITTDMSHFKELVDSVGGLTICVPKKTLAQDLKTVFPKGCQHMNGAHVLLYSRTRYDADDYHRMLKQRLIEKAIIQQVSPIELVMNYQKIARSAGQYVSTNIPAAKLGFLLNLGLKAKGRYVQNVEMSPPRFNMIKPNFKAIQALVQRTLKAN